MLRYELGAIREQTGEAVAVWRREQHTAYLRAKAMREEYPSCHRNDSSLKEWKHTEDLKGERKDGRKRAEAPAEADPLVGSSRGLRERLNVK